MNYLYLGDCLNVLRDSIENESVDLIYIDPPFNSKRDYNIFFDDKEIQTQRVAFEDTWTLKSIQESLGELHSLRTDKLYKLLITYQEVAPHAFPYLVMMSLRILELHRVLKSTGSFYLHCDPTMSHYLKTICDIIYDENNFRNEIVWSYKRYTAASNRFQRLHDIVLFYSKDSQSLFNDIRIEYGLKSGIADSHYKQDENGKWFRFQKRKGEEPYKIYLSEGRRLGDVWEIPIINASAKERLGYPTQKPKALLERIINASSNEGDTVLDAFCGCGTTVDAAEGLHRKWIGIDISPIALSLIKRRLNDTYKTSASKYEVRGTPVDEPSAIRLWKENEFAFQDWWLTELEVFSTTEGTRGPDKGIDGIGQYLIDKPEKTIRVAFQVKGGKVAPKDIDALIGILTKHKCELGVFLTIHEPTKAMIESATSAGFLELPNYQFPKIQILTLKEFFNNQKPKLPPTNITFRAAKFKGKKSQQIGLGL